VYTYDRRGRGESGDTSPYNVDRELEDVAAMLTAIGEPAQLLGHSAGGILALEAAERASELLSLTLYEPGYIVNGSRERPSPEILTEMQMLLAEGDRDDVVRIAIRETLGLSEHEIEAMSKGPGWEHLLAAAHTIPYDWMLWDREFIAARVSKVQTRSLMLMGSRSPRWLQVGTEAVLAALPNARLEVMQGQEHSAMMTAPEMFAELVTKFIEFR
jgi:pimeloyl-ACP methyl ester carboxylesterase